MEALPMVRKYFAPSTKEYITEDDDEIDVLQRLNEYFDERPDKTCPYLDSCNEVFEKRGKLSLGQFDTLRSIWNNLDDNFVAENRESC
jgi:hypothetical protein